jgi:hypothetical protein
MVFGSTTLALSWEPFQREIKTLSEVYADQPYLLVKHKKHLDMIGWAEFYPSTPITPAFACKINTGIGSADGVEKSLRACIYVDDALLLRHSKLQILMKSTALIEAIFVVMGKPDTTVRECPLAMDKCEELIIGPAQMMLGLVINTYKLTVGIPDTYVHKVLLLFNNNWHP